MAAADIDGFAQQLDARYIAAAGMRCGCRWSANSRSRMRWSRPALRSAPAARLTAVFAALEHLEGAKRPAGAGRRAQRRADLRRLRAQARRAGEGAAGAAAVCARQARRGIRRRRRPRCRQAAPDGRDRGRECRQRHRHRRQSAQRKSRPDPRRDPEPPRAAPAKSATARKRSGTAIAGLQPGDALLIAGKGHETGQIIGDRVLPFSDHDAVAAALAQRVA